MKRATIIVLIIFLIGTAICSIIPAAKGQTETERQDPVIVETFQEKSWSSRWQVSGVPDYSGSWRVEQVQEESLDGEPGNKGLVMGDKAKKHAISYALPQPIRASLDKELIVQRSEERRVG